ncbi:MAG TPA: adenylate/guanylate cyclase domain-containing protein [Candidatus Dormibacteraeota bacterium]|nr:adenylate/guanylate cyclase domain-containing protein [Candidatus Dormibacteraeota bacterium]
MTGAPPASGGVVTFLFSDIEGSTRLLDAIGAEAYSAILERHRAILRAAFARHGGREQGTEGDSFFVIFDSAREAVLAAVESQRGLATEVWPDGVDVAVRMGLHAGEASASAEGFVGLDIHRAARIAASAHGGQVVVSDAVRTLAGAELGPDVSLRGLGNHRLKDLREPQPLSQVVADGLRVEFPPLRSIDARPNNLPTQLTSFVGRERELADAGRLLAANRLVTLTGPGGTGKTRLSLQVAAEAAEDFPDGMFFVALETVRDPILVPSRLAAAVGIAEPARRTATEVLEEWLAGKRVLFVLDNFEQVLDAGPIIAGLLRAAPDLKVLATSRAALHVSGEQEYPVPGLPSPPDLSLLTALERANLPASERSVDAATLSTYEAVRLFIARAGSVRPGFSVTNENAPAVAAICARLHGMPLAIELAAARVKLLAPDAILARLEHQLNVLAAGSRDLPERQQTLRGAIAWSYDILDEPCRLLLDRLSVFAGDIELDAAEAVCGPASELGQDVVDGLFSLANQSLIRTIEDPNAPRFEMLDTIREYAGERLEARGQRVELEARHGRWFADFAKLAAAELNGADQRAWLEAFEHAHDNIRVALDRAVARQDAATAINLAFSTWRFWQKRGHLYEARRRLDAIAATDWSKRDPTLRARLEEAIGGVAWWQGDIVGMLPAYLEAVEIWRTLDNPAELANALYNYSFSFSIPDPAAPGVVDAGGEGRVALREALAIFRELGDLRGEANVLWGLGNMQYFANEIDPSSEDLALALEIFRKLGDRTMEAWTLHMLGGALIRKARLDEARDALRRALRVFYESSDTAGITLVLDDLSSQALADGDPDRAGRLWGAARNLATTTGVNLASLVDETMEIAARPNVRVRLDPDVLDRLAREGAAMALNDIVAYALDVPVDQLKGAAG